jgi:Protein of unknown function (DUF3305)
LSAALISIPVGVVLERRKAASQWIDFTWRPVAVLPGEPATNPWTVLSQDDETTTYYAGGSIVELYRGETSNYRDNLIAGPQLWVILRSTGVEPPYEIVRVTADPSEGEAFTETGGDLVEPVPMPEPIRDALAAFVAEHHVERPFYKRQRKRADPEALAPRRREDDE